LILLLAIFAGLVAGLLRSWTGKRNLQIPHLHWLWLVLLAYLPQFFAFQYSRTRTTLPTEWIPIILIVTQILLLIFTIINWRQAGFWLLGIGLVLNLTVISLNNGWMPISPETVAHVAPDAPPGSWEIGKRLGSTKDKVISTSQTNLPILTDRFVLPGWVPYQVAFSIGDIFIALGAFWFFWSMGGPKDYSKPERIVNNANVI
jgi:Family of unknown function (DUF5317)